MSLYFLQRQKNDAAEKFHAHLSENKKQQQQKRNQSLSFSIKFNPETMFLQNIQYFPVKR